MEDIASQSRSILEHTFCHFPGIGLKTERHLWERGLSTWEDLVEWAAKAAGHGQLSRAAALVEESREQLCAGNAEYFFERLPTGQQWRAFSDFKERVAYLDIETTGLTPQYDYITTIALYDGRDIRVYVHGRNLEQFASDIRRYGLLVTYNGKCFDLPVIERQFDIRLPKAHIDLRYVLGSLGFKGGLKGCEKRFGLGRNELEGLDGYFAVLLWSEFRRTRREEVLETLLAYNVADVLSLETLMAHAVNLHLAQMPFGNLLAVDVPSGRANPLTPDGAVIESIRRRYFYHR
ncbi:MAG: ribonuclease H-like domain-containing protein [Bradymonadales bacterium]|nr:ribonuclease H-like domain-containing protein [Bradymonadales bacterium]